jgi:hypothetical protein
MGYGDRTDFTKDKRSIPGPGNYNFASLETISNKPTTPKYTIGTRSDSKTPKNEPGPGFYDQEDLFGKDMKGINFGGKTLEKIPETPGPGTYDSDALEITKHHGPFYSHGSKPRFSESPSKTVPDSG